MATKLCYGCNQQLEANAENFHKHPKTKDGLTTRCKSCTNTTNRSKYFSSKITEVLGAMHETIKAIPEEELSEIIDKTAANHYVEQHASIEKAILSEDDQKLPIEEENLWD